MKRAQQKYWNKENINNADMPNIDIYTYVAAMSFYLVAQVVFEQWSEVAEGTSGSQMYFWPVKHSGISNNKLVHRWKGQLSGNRQKLEFLWR